MIDQQILRKEARIAKAQNYDYGFKSMAEAIDISPNAFYNWLSGSFDLSYRKARELESLIADLTD